MALKDKFVGALASRTGLPMDKARLALEQTVELIKTKVPTHVGKALDDLLNSDNGIDAAVFIKVVEHLVVEAPKPTVQMAQPVYSMETPTPAPNWAGAWSSVKKVFSKLGALFKSTK